MARLPQPHLAAASPLEAVAAQVPCVWLAALTENIIAGNHARRLGTCHRNRHWEWLEVVRGLPVPNVATGEIEPLQISAG